MHETEPVGTEFAEHHGEGEFAQLVQDELKGDKNLRGELQVPELLPYWEDELIRLKQELECQLTERELVLSSDEYKTWRVSVLRLRFCVEARLRHVKQLRRQEHNGKENRLGRRVSGLERRVEAMEELLKGDSGCIPTPSLDAS